MARTSHWTLWTVRTVYLWTSMLCCCCCVYCQSNADIQVAVDDSVTQQQPQQQSDDAGATYRRLNDVIAVSGNDSISGAENVSSTHYFWRETDFSECSVTCGAGEELTAFFCYDNSSEERVADNNCSETSRPAGSRRVCQRPSCPLWIPGEWSECSVTCGDAGTKTRVNYCVRASDGLEDSDLEPVDPELCPPEAQPETQAECSATQECPSWIAGQWSQCSATCGVGQQSRAVLCRRNSATDQCLDVEKPEEVRPCRSHVPCHGDTDVPDAFHGPMVSIEEQNWRQGLRPGIGDWRGNEVAENGHRRSPAGATEDGGRRLADVEGRDGRVGIGGWTLLQPSRSSSEDNFIPETAGVIVVVNSEAGDTQPSSTDDVMWPTEVASSSSTRSGTFDTTTAARLTIRDSFLQHDGRKFDKVENEIAVEPRFVTSSWSACSVTCGLGTRSRDVVCKGVVDSTATLETVADFNCPGQKPATVESCLLAECVSESDKFAWSVEGYGSCSRTCAGGFQQAVYSCVRLSDMLNVDSSFCSHLTVPAVPVKKCAKQPCPPRWLVTPDGECSKLCGGGEQRWLATCTQQVDHSGSPSSTQTLPDAVCRLAGLAIPVVKSSCNPEPCPQPENSTGAAADGERSAAAAAGSVWIVPERSDFIQLSPVDGGVSVVVGGTVTVLDGTPVSVHCPTSADAEKSRRRQPKVTWTRENGDGKTVKLSGRGRVRVDRNGVLRIRSVGNRTAGTYTCRITSSSSGGGSSSSGDHRSSASISVRLHSLEDAVQWMDVHSMAMAMDGGQVSDWMEEATNAGIVGRLGGLKKEEERKKMQGGKEDKKPEQNDATFSVRYLTSLLSPTTVIPVFYSPLDWSPCSVPCGLGGGLQTRRVACTLLAGDGSWALDVDESVCAASARRRGGQSTLVRPITERDCGFEDCARWKMDDWGQCSSKRCQGVGLGVHKRRVYCVSGDGQRLDSSKCRRDSRPRQRQECPHAECRAVWKSSNWTQCAGDCGKLGAKKRNVSCVWASNRKPASSTACDVTAPRPATQRSCRVTQCSQQQQQQQQQQQRQQQRSFGLTGAVVTSSSATGLRDT